MKLDLKDRLIIANQCKILEKLYPEEADYYAKHRAAVERGYQLHYSWLVEHFYDEMTEEECREVLDILDMYRALTFAYQRQEGESRIAAEDVKFPGFDGNNETKQFSYAQYFVVELGRYQELTEGKQYPDLNSHTEMLPEYRQMLEKWRTLADKSNLSASQIHEVIGT